MLLNYRIYKLSESIDSITNRHHAIEKSISDDDEDAQAYLRELTKVILEKSRKLDKLKAERYRRKYEGRVGM
jgi:hypothetical protein